MAKGLKTFFRVAVIANIVFVAMFVFALPTLALNVDYPTLPGVGTLSGQAQPGYWVKYVFNLAIYIAIGICFLTVFYAGVLQLMSGARADLAVKARATAQRGILGMLIVIGAYAVLYVVSPNLLFLKANLSLLGPGQFPKTTPLQLAKAAFVEVPLTTLLAESQQMLEKKVKPIDFSQKDKDGKYNVEMKDVYLLGEDGKYSPIEGSLSDFQAPFYEAHWLTSKLYLKTSQLTKLFECGQCGMSKVRSDLDFSKSLTSPRAVCSLGVVDIKENKTCENVCDNCDFVLKCVNEAVIVWNKENEGTFGFEKLVLPWESTDNLTALQRNKKLNEFFKQKAKEIQILVQALEALKTQKAVKYQGMLFTRGLEIQKAGYLDYFGKEGLTETELQFFQQELQNNNITKKQSQPKDQEKPKASSFVAYLASVFDSGATGSTQTAPPPLVIIDIPLFWQEIKKNYGSSDLKSNFLPIKEFDAFSREAVLNNKIRIEESNLLSQFLMMAGLSLDELQKMIVDCLEGALASLGVSGDVFTSEQVQEMARVAVEKGILDNIKNQIYQGGSEISSAFLQEISSQTKAKVLENCQKSCKIKCAKPCDGANCADNCCLRECKKIPVNFISQTIAKAMTEPIENRLPDEINKVLNQTVEQAVLKPEFSQNFLDTNLLGLIQRGMGDIAKKSLQEQFPQIMALLQTQLVSYLGDDLNQWLAKIDLWLARYTDGAKAKANKAVDDFLQDQVAKLTLWINQKTGVAEKQAKILAKLQEEDSIGINKWLGEYSDKIGEHWYDKPSFVESCMKKWGGQNIKSEKSPEWNLPVSRQECETVMWDVYKDQLDEEKKSAMIDSLADLSVWGGMFKETGQEFLGLTVQGFVALPGQLAIALAETSAELVKNYIAAAIEDEIYTRFYPEIQQANELKETFRKTLDLTIKDVLPSFLKSALEKNLIQNTEALLKEICSAGAAAKNSGKDTATLSPETQEWFTAGGSISTDTALAACQLSKNLHGKMREKMGEDVNKLLATKVEEMFPQKFQDLLEKSPAQLLFEGAGVANITEVIKTSPKELICGEEKFYQEATKDFWNAKCLATGTLAFDPDKLETFGLSETEKDRCWQIYQVCSPMEKQFAFLEDRLNNLLVGLIEKECGYIGQKQCNGLSFVSGEVACSGCEQDFKAPCFWCNFFNNRSLGYSLMFYLVKEKYVAPGDVYPETSGVWWSTIEKELKAYQDFWVIFPKLEREIDRLAKARGLEKIWNQAQAWNLDKNGLSPRNEIKQIVEQKRLTELSDVAKSFASAFFQNKTLGYFLTSIPDNIVKPTVAGDPTWLRDRGFGEQTNIFAKTPYTFLQTICAKVDKEQKKIESSLPPYNQLSQAEKQWYKVAQGSCLILTSPLAKAWGIDKKLVEYTDGYKGMFDILQPPYIETNEMPPALNEFLQFIRTQTPVGGLRWLGQQTEGDTGKAMVATADFLDKGGLTIMANSSQAEFFKTPLIEQVFPIFCEPICKEYWQQANRANRIAECSKSCEDALKEPIANVLSLEKFKGVYDALMQYLQKTPVQVLQSSKFLNNSLLGVLMSQLQQKDKDQINVIFKNGIVGYLAKQYKSLDMPLIDLIGRQFGLDIALKDGLMKADDASSVVNNAVAKTESALQNITEQAFTKTGDALITGIAGMFNSESLAMFSKRLFLTTTGGCEPMKPEDKDRCKSEGVFGKVYTQESGALIGQCCDLASALVCDKKVGKCEKCRFLQTGNSCAANEILRSDYLDPNGKPIQACCRVSQEKNNQCCQTLFDCIVEKVSQALAFSLQRTQENGYPNDSIFFDAISSQ